LKNLYSKKEFIIGLCAIMVLLSLLYSYYLQQLGFSNFISWADSAIAANLLLFAGFLISNLLSYYAPTKSKHIFILGCAFILSVLWLAASYYISSIYFTNSAYLKWLQDSFALRFLFSFQFLTAIGFYNLLWQEQQNNNTMKAQQDQIKTLARDAELYKLRQQLQPHFLFNSLNSINSLIGSQPEKARKMIVSLSDFLRKTLHQEESEMVTLDNEMEYCILYLEIEKNRFGHRLATEIDIPESLKLKKIPNLILQPIIENAIKYGLYNTTEDVVICIKAFQKNNLLIIEISNPFDINNSKPSIGNGFGLRGINRRLQLIYNQNNLVTIKNENNIFTTTLHIPQFN
jgi:two-component system, LytTR family, sensor kinase